MPNKPSTDPDAPDLPPNALVCVVDDDRAVRQGVCRLLHSFSIRSEGFESAAAFLDRASHPGPTCLVLDVRMPGLDGLELQREIAGRCVPIIFLTGHGDVAMCAEAMKAGAIDFLTKPVDEKDLIAAVQRALQRAEENRGTTEQRELARARISSLTPRELEVLRCVIAGALNKQIADELGVAEKTVKIHRGRVMEKMGVASVAGLVRMAHAAGVEPVREPE